MSQDHGNANEDATLDADDGDRVWLRASCVFYRPLQSDRRYCSTRAG